MKKETKKMIRDQLIQDAINMIDAAEDVYNVAFEMEPDAGKDFDKQTSEVDAIKETLKKRLNKL